MSKSGADWREAPLWVCIALAGAGLYAWTLWDRSRVSAAPPPVEEVVICSKLLKVEPVEVSICVPDPETTAAIYRIDDGEDLAGEAALTEAVRKLAAAEPGTDRRISIELGRYPFFGRSPFFSRGVSGYVTPEVLKRAKAACEVAGVDVASLPELPPLRELVERTSDGRVATMEVQIVGITGDSYQFRAADRLAEGTDALAALVCERANALRKAQGGVVMIRPRIFPVQELDIPEHRLDQIRDAVLAVCPEATEDMGLGGSFGWRGRDWYSRPSKVQIVDQCDAGNRYSVDGKIVEGDAALQAALRESLKAWRAGAVQRARQEVARREEAVRQAEAAVEAAEAMVREMKQHPERCTLDVDLKVAPDAEASEEQLAAARSAIAASGVLKVGPTPRSQPLRTAPGK